MPQRVARRLRRTLVRRPPSIGGARRVVLEGGAIDVNGRGTLLTTEECLLSAVQARNPGLGRAASSSGCSRDHLGVRKVLWLGDGIAGDDTHGHVDDLARFVDPRTVVRRRVRRPGATRTTSACGTIATASRAMTDQDGRPLRVVELPMPAPLVFDGQRLPASYANFYIANAVVLVPDVQRSGRPAGARRSWPSSSPTAASSASTPSTSCWGSAPSTA